jgi:hypothetical protein
MATIVDPFGAPADHPLHGGGSIVRLRKIAANTWRVERHS